MTKIFDISRYKKIIIAIVFAVILWFGILLFGVLESSREMYYSYIPENSIMYVNIADTSLGSLNKNHISLVHGLLDNVNYDELFSKLTSFTDDVILAVYKDVLGQNQIVLVGKNNNQLRTFVDDTLFFIPNNENQLAIYSSEKNYQLNELKHTEQLWQKGLKSFYEHDVIGYISEDVHHNKDVSDVFGSLNIENNSLGFNLEKSSGSLFSEVDTIDDVFIPNNFAHTVYFNENVDFKSIFAKLDYNMYEIYGKYLDNPTFDFITSFNELNTESNYQVTMVNTGHKDLYENFITYSKEQVAYLYPIKKETFLGDGTPVNELIADISAHVEFEDRDSVFFNIEESQIKFTVQRDGKNIILKNFTHSLEQKLLSDLQKQCLLKTKKYPFYYQDNFLRNNEKKDINIQKQNNFFVQSSSRKLEGCILFNK